MSNFSDEKPATLMSWSQRFGFLITVMFVTYVVVSIFSSIFGPAGGAR